MSAHDTNATMAVFLDLENIAIGAREARYPRFDIRKMLERLLLKGHIVVKKAYCDFDRYKEFKRDLHEAAFELIEIPHVRQSGKNSADIRMVVDALDLCYTKGHVDTFVIISGDSDFSPLVSKLRENAKTVIGIGVKNSTADLFINNCDQFIYYDDVVREEAAKSRRTPVTVVTTVSGTGTKKKSTRGRATKAVAEAAGTPENGAESGENGAGNGAETGVVSEAEEVKIAENPRPSLAEALELVVLTLEALLEDREEDERIWGSMIKQAIKRRNPGFNERAHGFRSFNDLLLEAQKRSLVKLEADQKSGGYTVQAVD